MENGADSEKTFDFDIEFTMEKETLCAALGQMYGEALKDSSLKGKRRARQFVEVLFCWGFFGMIFSNATAGLCVALLLFWFCTYAWHVYGKSARKYEKLFEKGKMDEALLKPQTVRFGETGILQLGENREVFTGWKQFSWLLVFEDVFCLCSKNYKKYMILPGNAVGDKKADWAFGMALASSKMEKSPESASVSLAELMKGEYGREIFIRYCVKKGLREKQCHGREDSQKKESRKSNLHSFVVTIALVTLVMVVQGGRIAYKIVQSEKAGENSEGQTEEEFVFNPLDYPDYVSFERQLEVLKSLGILIPEEDAENYRKRIEQDEESRVYIEGYPYDSILEYTGGGIYDEDTEKMQYSGSVYYYYFEEYNDGQDYVYALEGISTLGQGEVTFTDIVLDADQADWEKGTGDISVFFTCGGHPYRFDTQVNYGWMDKGLITYLNEVLKNEGSEKQLYCLEDKWGVCLFYNTPEWADKFAEETGKTLTERIE